MSAFRPVQEEQQWYNPQHLEEYRLAEKQIAGEQASPMLMSTASCRSRRAAMMSRTDRPAQSSTSTAGQTPRKSRRGTRARCDEEQKN